MKSRPLILYSKYRLLALFTLASISINAKDYSLIPYRVGNQWGFCDKDKNVIIKPQFERTYWFADNGLAKVRQNGKYGYIDKQGRNRIEARFDEASDFHFSGALVSLNDKSYCLDKEGKLEETDATTGFGCSGLESAVGDSGCSNCCEPFQVKKRIGIVCTKIFYLDGVKQTTTDSIPAQYDTIYSSIGYSPDFMPLIALKGKKYGIVDSKNEVIHDFAYDSIKVISHRSYFLKSGETWALTNQSEVVFTGISAFKSYFFYSGNYFPVKIGGKWGVIDSDGQEVIPFQFEEIKLPNRSIIQREFTIKLDGKWGYISDKGNVKPIYDSLEPFNGYEYTLVVKDGKEGYINRLGEEFFHQ